MPKVSQVGFLVVSPDTGRRASCYIFRGLAGLLAGLQCSELGWAGVISRQTWV